MGSERRNNTGSCWFAWIQRQDAKGGSGRHGSRGQETRTFVIRTSENDRVHRRSIHHRERHVHANFQGATICGGEEVQRTFSEDLQAYQCLVYVSFAFLVYKKNEEERISVQLITKQVFNRHFLPISIILYYPWSMSVNPGISSVCEDAGGEILVSRNALRHSKPLLISVRITNVSSSFDRTRASCEMILDRTSTSSNIAKPMECIESSTRTCIEYNQQVYLTFISNGSY